MKWAALLIFACFTGVSAAVTQGNAALGTGAILRSLDRQEGRVANVVIAPHEAARIGALTVELGECRYPAGDPAGDAYAYLKIRNGQTGEEFFAGWMVASSPALNALEHHRYDIWVLRCNTE